MFAGVDSHKGALAVCLVDQTGRSHAQASFANTPTCHHQLATWLDRYGPATRVGVEGSANLGAALARFLAAEAVDGHRLPRLPQVCRRLTAERSLAAAEQLLADLSAVRAQLARRRIARLRELDQEIRELADQLARLVAASRTRLIDLVGVGPILAARILGEVGDIARFPDADHFAAANGTAPIPVASGRTDRHRLNRGGNRRLNRALYYVALIQATWEPRAVTYLAPASWPRASPPRRPCGVLLVEYPGHDPRGVGL